MPKSRVLYIAIAVFIAYTVWMMGPYMRSVIVRDAAVTTWSRAAVSPIAGTIATKLPDVGSQIGGNGHVATIRNDLLLQEKKAVETTRDRSIALETRVRELEELLDDLDQLDRERLASLEQHKRVFIDRLKLEIQDLRSSLAINKEQITATERIVNRQKALVARGAGSPATLDEANLRLARMRSIQVELTSRLHFATLRNDATQNGIYISKDGETLNWATRGELELKLERHKARHSLHNAEAALVVVKRELALEEETLARLSQSVIAAPPGSVVVSVLAKPTDTLAAGDRIIEWIDCAKLMVDVPVSDAELPLLKRGMTAEVILEGEPRTRRATVHLTRGSTVTLGTTDLTAVAKGRRAGIAQVLLRLEADPHEFDQCPVGRAAYVEFPGVGLIDVIRARLRL